MSEFSDFIPAINERHVQRADGTFAAYDLQEAEEGTTLGFITERGAFELTKVVVADSALEGWKHVERGQSLGAAVRLVLLETNEGASFLTPSIVVRPGTEMGVVEPGSNQPNVIKSLGVVGELWDRPLTVEEKAEYC